MNCSKLGRETSRFFWLNHSQFQARARSAQESSSLSSTGSSVRPSVSLTVHPSVGLARSLSRFLVAVACAMVQREPALYLLASSSSSRSIDEDEETWPHEEGRICVWSAAVANQAAPKRRRRARHPTAILESEACCFWSAFSCCSRPNGRQTT